MAFEYRPHPEFAWSMSRQRKLDRCPRQFFYSYHLAWNGWLDDAPEASRTAYRLNKLTTLDALLGQEVDARARELETAARGARALPSAEDLEVRTRGALRRAWTLSRDGRAAFESRPGDVVMLRSLYLEQDTQPETDRLNEKAGPSMAGLLATAHWQRLRGAGEAGRLEVPPFAHFVAGGLKVYAAPDLAYVHRSAVYVVDWKTGRPDESDADQVLLQVRWVAETWPELAGLPVHACLEYVVAGRTEPVEAGPDYRERTAAIVEDGVARMRAYLDDPEANVPRPMEAWERRTGGLCRTCSFLPICE